MITANCHSSSRPVFKGVCSTTSTSILQVVSLHCALDEKSKHLMNKERLEMMKPDAILVNAARGPVHDEQALVAHLQANPNFRSAWEQS